VRIGLQRSLAAVRRATATRGALASTTTRYPVVTRAWLEVRAPKRLATAFGAGDSTRGTMEAEGHEGADVRRDDILEVESGPEEGTRWKVLSAHRPGDGSLVLALEVFAGDAPT
jgi:hypothetical protein